MDRSTGAGVDASPDPSADRSPPRPTPTDPPLKSLSRSSLSCTSINPNLRRRSGSGPPGRRYVLPLKDDSRDVGLRPHTRDRDGRLDVDLAAPRLPGLRLADARRAQVLVQARAENVDPVVGAVLPRRLGLGLRL